MLNDQVFCKIYVDSLLNTFSHSVIQAHALLNNSKQIDKKAYLNAENAYLNEQGPPLPAENREPVGTSLSWLSLLQIRYFGMLDTVLTDLSYCSTANLGQYNESYLINQKYSYIIFSCFSYWSFRTLFLSHDLTLVKYSLLEYYKEVYQLLVYWLRLICHS